MKKLIILFLFTVIFFGFAIVLSAQNSSRVFKTDVETIKKPWTNLDFQNDPNNFQFAIMSDNTGGNRPGVFKDAVDKLNLLRPEFVMCVGDLIPGNTKDPVQLNKEWSEINSTIYGLDMPFFYLPGNHDISNEYMAKEWEKRYGQRYYNFVYKNTLFIVLDSNDDDDNNLSQKQTDFVLKSLKENEDVRWTFILVHHPIWDYDTGGRFETIQEALKNRKHTVIAGHVHRYHHSVKNNANYYTLATTGAGSSLSGENFGLFDHISWMTMTDDGPVMANLKLDGILPHNITNDKTMKRATPLLANTHLKHILLCNKGEKFEHGTLYFSFKNPSKEDLKININFFHHHQLIIPNAEIEIVVNAGEDKIIEIPITSSKSMDYNEIDLLRCDWSMRYVNSDEPNFGMEGKFQFFVEPGISDFIDNNINEFAGKTMIVFNNPYENLTVKYKLNNSSKKNYTHPIEISENSSISFTIENSKNEYLNAENRSFTKIKFQKASRLKMPKTGLKYKYYEGIWDTIPDFRLLTPKMEGVVNDFLVSDIAQRENSWALVYTGYIKIDKDGFKTFRVNSENNQCRFYINNKIVTDKNTITQGKNVGAVLLKKGYHPVRIEYFGKDGNKRLRFYTSQLENADWDYMEFDRFYY